MDEPKTRLRLISSQDLTPALVYGMLFKTMADEVDSVKERARFYYDAALKYGVDPANMEADYALAELDLAEVSNVATIDGSPVFNYLPRIDAECTCDDEKE